MMISRMISKRREEKKERRKKNSARITIMEGIGEINSWKVREWYYRGDVKRWEVMLLVESWWVLSNEDQDRSKWVKRGLRCRVDVSPFRRSPLYIFPSYTDCSHFPKFFFSSFSRQLFQFEDYLSFFTRINTHEIDTIDRRNIRK